jgi:hypothetical protein
MTGSWLPMCCPGWEQMQRPKRNGLLAQTPSHHKRVWCHVQSCLTALILLVFGHYPVAATNNRIQHWGHLLQPHTNLPFLPSRLRFPPAPTRRVSSWFRSSWAPRTSGDRSLEYMTWSIPCRDCSPGSRTLLLRLSLQYEFCSSGFNHTSQESHRRELCVRHCDRRATTPRSKR